MKHDISKIDSNFKVETQLNKPDIRFFDVKQIPEILFGVQHDGERFRRMPQSVGDAVNESVESLSRCTAGGRLRFVTDSPYVAISVKMSREATLPHMAHTGVSGFDMYADGVFRAEFVPPVPIGGGYERSHTFSDGAKKRLITIGFPLYNYVEEVYLGIREGAVLEAAPAYTYDRPVVYYGSSITQGACSSRPSLSYPAYISRWLDCDYINLGFSGNAKGELVLAEYAASLNPSVFVLDYDYNAPDYEHLKATHEPFFKRFRELCPDTPVVMISSPSNYWRSDLAERNRRRDLIRENYEKAVANGDDKVCFIDGDTLFGDEDWDACAVDGCHPNDLGFYRMAKRIAPEVRRFLETR